MAVCDFVQFIAETGMWRVEDCQCVVAYCDNVDIWYTIIAISIIS